MNIYLLIKFTHTHTYILTTKTGSPSQDSGRRENEQETKRNPSVQNAKSRRSIRDSVRSVANRPPLFFLHSPRRRSNATIRSDLNSGHRQKESCSPVLRERKKRAGEERGIQSIQIGNTMTMRVSRLLEEEEKKEEVEGKITKAAIIGSFCRFAACRSLGGGTSGNNGGTQGVGNNTNNTRGPGWKWLFGPVISFRGEGKATLGEGGARSHLRSSSSCSSSLLLNFLALCLSVVSRFPWEERMSRRFFDFLLEEKWKKTNLLVSFLRERESLFLLLKQLPS